MGDQMELGFLTVTIWLAAIQGSLGTSSATAPIARSPALEHELALQKGITDSFLSWLDKMEESQREVELKKLRFGKRGTVDAATGAKRQRVTRSIPAHLTDFGDLGEHILENEASGNEENTLVVKKLASLIRPRFGKRGLPPMKSITGKAGPLSKVLAYVAENLNRNYFWVNRAYKMSRLNSDNKLKFGKKKKRNTALSPLNFTKQKVLMPDVLNEASQLLDSGLAEQIMADAEDEDMGDRLGRGLPYKPLFFEDGDAVGQQQQKGEPLLVEALGDYARMHKQLQVLLSNLRRGAVRIA